MESGRGKFNLPLEKLHMLILVEEMKNIAGERKQTRRVSFFLASDGNVGAFANFANFLLFNFISHFEIMDIRVLKYILRER